MGIADSPAGNFARMWLFRPMMWMGNGLELGGIGSSRVGAAMKAVALAYEGLQNEAREILASDVFGDVWADDGEPAAGVLLNLLEVAVLTGDRARAALLESRLPDLAGSICDYVPSGAVTSFARHLGAAAAFLGRPADARAYYATGLAACEKIRFRPEIALIKLQLAELLLDHHPDERAEAIEHLDFAIAELRQMKMAPSLERAEALLRSTK